MDPCRDKENSITKRGTTDVHVLHYTDVTMSLIASQITSLTIL